MISEFEGGWFGGEDCPIVRRHRGWLVVIDFLRGSGGWAIGRDEFGVAGVETVA